MMALVLVGALVFVQGVTLWLVYQASEVSSA